MHGNEFLKKMEAGDSTVWDDLMPMLRRIALGACRDLGVYDSLKEDVVQDVAVRAFTHWQSYSGESALTTWLYSIARNRCIDEMRKRKVRGDGFSSKTNLSDDVSDDASASSPSEPSYDSKLDLMLCVQQVLAQLDAQGPARRGSHRMIDVLRYWVEHSTTIEELSVHLKTTVQAAKQRKYEIRKCIEELCLQFCGHSDCSLHIVGDAS